MPGFAHRSLCACKARFYVLRLFLHSAYKKCPARRAVWQTLGGSVLKRYADEQKVKKNRCIKHTVDFLPRETGEMYENFTKPLPGIINILLLQYRCTVTRSGQENRELPQLGQIEVKGIRAIKL